MGSSIVCLHLLSNTEISSLVDYADVLSRLALSFKHQKLLYFGELQNIQKFYQELKLIGGPNNILNSGQNFYREKPEMRVFIHKLYFQINTNGLSLKIFFMYPQANGY